jgi:hypothetical protein
VFESTVNEVAGAVSNLTAVAPVKPVPVMVTVVPPTVGPEVGVTELTVGAATKVKWSPVFVGEVPPGLVTVTSTAPAVCGGEVAVI